MSASEKLKGLWNLDAQRYQNGAIDQAAINAANRHVDALVAATPQIVAVVEAAERIAHTEDSVWGTSDGVGFVLQDALSALDEALS